MTSCPGVAPTTVAWALPHQRSLKKLSHCPACRSFSQLKFPFSHLTLAYAYLINKPKNQNQNKNKNLTRTLTFLERFYFEFSIIKILCLCAHAWGFRRGYLLAEVNVSTDYMK